MNVTVLKIPTKFYFEIQYFNFDWKKYNHTSSQSQKHSTVTSQTEISVIQSESATAHCSHSTVVST